MYSHGDKTLHEKTHRRNFAGKKTRECICMRNIHVNISSYLRSPAVLCLRTMRDLEHGRYEIVHNPSSSRTLMAKMVNLHNGLFLNELFIGTRLSCRPIYLQVEPVFSMLPQRGMKLQYEYQCLSQLNSFTEAGSLYLNGRSPRRKIIVKENELIWCFCQDNVKAKKMCQQVNIY